MSHEFELSQEVELAATPEEVWEAIATGPGTDSWFMGHTEIEPREGGTTRFTMAGRTDEGTVTAWEPRKRFAFRSGTSEDGSFLAFDYLIEGRDQGSTVLRLVQSGVLGGDWETEYEAMKTGWKMYLGKLAEYLTHFRGRTVTAVVTAFRPQVADHERFWAVLKGELGLSGTVAEGDRVRLAPTGLAPVEGVVDYVDFPTFLGVRSSEGMYRFIHSGPLRGDAAILGHHIFGAAADQQETEQAWQAWLTGLSFT
jgi:uncharacterized protein YndB with AHSA1/START domain